MDVEPLERPNLIANKRRDESAAALTLKRLPLSLYPRPGCYAFQAQSTGGHPRRGRRQAFVPLDRAAIETCGAAGGEVSSCGRADLELYQLGCHSHVRFDAIQLRVTQPSHRDDVSLLAFR